MAGGSSGPGRDRPNWGETPGPRKAPPASRKAPPRAPRPPGKPASKAQHATSPTRPARPARSARPPGPSRKPTARRAPRKGGSFRKRYGVVHDIEGPRVRFGILWFFTAAVAILAGPAPTAVVYGGVGAAAAWQAARTWRTAGIGASDLMAAGGVGVMALGALFGPGGAGLGMLGCVALSFVGASGEVGSRHPRIVDIGVTLQCALAPGVTAMSVVLLVRYDQGSAIALLLVASAFEAGDFLIGTSARNPYEGPGAGAAAIVVITFIVSTLPVSALSFGQAWALGGAMVLLAPFGQFLASAVLPSATAPALALRRLDTLLIAAPVWAWVAGMAVGV